MAGKKVRLALGAKGSGAHVGEGNKSQHEGGKENGREALLDAVVPCHTSMEVLSASTNLLQAYLEGCASRQTRSVLDGGHIAWACIAAVQASAKNVECCTVWLLVENEAADDADEHSHERAAGHVGGVARVRLQRAPLQHTVLVPHIRREGPAQSPRSLLSRWQSLSPGE